MKIMKKVVLYVLAGILLGPFACFHINNTAECSSVSGVGAGVTTGPQRWSADWTSCTYPNTKVSEYWETSTQTIQISCSGEDTNNFQIIPKTMDGFTASEDNTSTFVTYMKTKPDASVQEFLRNVQYECATSQSITILLSESAIPNDVHYYPGTGHFYKYVSSLDITWVDAYNNSQASEFGGWKGYLANIISKGEHDFVLKYAGNNTGNNVGWLGGTRATLSGLNTANVTISNNNIGYWYWTGGPELCAKLKPQYSSWSIEGKNRPISKEESEYFDYDYSNPSPQNSVFYEKIKHSQTTSGFTGHMPFKFNMWASGEPSQTGNGGEEPFLATVKNNKLWNDSVLTGYPTVDNHRIYGYTIEYGDRLWGNSTPLAGSIIVSTNITKQTTSIAPTQNDELGNYQPTISGTGAPGYTVNIVEDGKILGTTQVDPDGYWSVQLSNPSLGMHTVSVTQADPSGNTFPSVSLSFKILKTPTLDLFDIALTEDLTYNCALKQFVVTLMPGVTGMGPFAVKYFKVNSDGTEAELDGPPTDVGRYRAKLYIEKGSDYTAAVFRIVYFPKT